MGITNYFTKLYKNHRSLALITWSYILITLVGLLLSGIFALLDQELGRAFLILPLISFLACLSNLIIWAVIKLFIDTISTPFTLGQPEPNKTTTKSSSKK